MKIKAKLLTLLLVGLLIFMISFIIFKFSPTLGKVLALQNKVKKEQMNFKQLEAELKQQKNTVKLKEDLTTKERLNAIPVKLRTEEFLTELKNILSQSNLRLVKYLPKEIVTKDRYLKLPILLELEGKYRGINSLLQELDELTRLVRVEEIRLFNKEDKLQCTLLLSIYGMTAREVKQ